MKKLSTFAALLAAVLVASFSLGSSHREAPNTAQDPTADDTDVYAFAADDAQGSLTVVANWIPFEDPAGGPNFYNFDARARYYINVDNTGDGVYDVRLPASGSRGARCGSAHVTRCSSTTRAWRRRPPETGARRVATFVARSASTRGSRRSPHRARCAC